jgi:hypothetical protein
LSRGIHTQPVRGMSNDWITPPTIIEALGPFDVDPCAHPKQFYRTAKRMIALPEDGLAKTWRGRVWLNPPYGSEISMWLKRMAKHGCGCALVPGRTEVESWFWPYIWEAASAVLFLRGRLYFHKPDGSTLGNAGHGSVIAAYGGQDAEKLRWSGIRGAYVRLGVPALEGMTTCALLFNQSSGTAASTTLPRRSWR